MRPREPGSRAAEVVHRLGKLGGIESAEGTSPVGLVEDGDFPTLRLPPFDPQESFRAGRECLLEGHPVTPELAQRLGQLLCLATDGDVVALVVEGPVVADPKETVLPIALRSR